MTNKSRIIFAIIGLIIFSFCVEGWGADWRLYFSGDYGDHYYDTESITHPSKNILRVWEKWVFTEQGVIQMVTEVGEKYKTLSFQIVLSEVDCAEKKFRGLSINSYSKDGGVLYTKDFQDLNWNFIVPESNGDILYKILCK